MILYRVMSLEEFEAYKAGKTIRAHNGGSVSKSHNCWHRPMLCFSHRPTTVPTGSPSILAM